MVLSTSPRSDRRNAAGSVTQRTCLSGPSPSPLYSPPGSDRDSKAGWRGLDSEAILRQPFHLRGSGRRPRGSPAVPRRMRLARDGVWAFPTCWRAAVRLHAELQSVLIPTRCETAPDDNYLRRLV
jgi:hypothetical protein